MKWLTRTVATLASAGLIAGCMPELPTTVAPPDQGFQTQQIIIGDPGPFGFGGYPFLPWGLTDPWIFSPPYYSSLLAGAGWGLPFGFGGYGLGYGGYGLGYGGYGGYGGYDLGYGGHGYYGDYSRGHGYSRGHHHRGRGIGHGRGGHGFDRGHHRGRGIGHGRGGHGLDRGHHRGRGIGHSRGGHGMGRGRGIAEQNSVAYRPAGSKIWRSKK